MARSKANRGAKRGSAGNTPPSAHTRALAVANISVSVSVVLCAFVVIYATHACRTLYAELQVLEAQQWDLQEDYGRLLLEQSTWASHHRVEKVARSDLSMAAPDLARFKVVPQ